MKFDRLLRGPQLWLTSYRPNNGRHATMPGDMNQDAAADLGPLRRQIDELDGRIVELLNRRAQVVVEIGKSKQRSLASIYAPDREQQVMERVRSLNRGPLPDACVEAIWRELMSGSFKIERPLRVGYLGPPGSFSHLAARQKFGACVGYEPVETIADVFDQLARGHLDLGLVPIENSTHGGVGETLDAFTETDVKVCAEVAVGVHHHLMAKGPLDQVTKVYSKPEALNQCRRWLGTELAKADRVGSASTARAAEIAAAETGAAAIGCELAAEIYGLDVLASNIEDNPSNVTRFFVLSDQPAKPTSDDKTAVMFTTVHVAGALANVLDVFRNAGLNLTHIDKRPSHKVNWEYFFFIEFEGHHENESAEAALAAAAKHCLQLTVLGSFPCARDAI